jgi:hypothetical protein
MPIRRILLPLAALGLAGCGAIGDLQPPTLDIPRKVTGLRVLERADKIVLEFTIPELTTEGLALKLAKVDCRVGPYTQSPFDAEAWASRAQALDTAGLKPGPARLEMDAGRWTGQELFFRVRLFSQKGKDSGWSDFATLRVIPPLSPPSDLHAESTAKGVSLSWTDLSGPPGLVFRIFRSAGTQPAAEVATASTHEWLDVDTRYGETYEYSVQAALKTGASWAESKISQPVSITPVDRFPPSVPQGLTGLAASSSIELAWDPDREPDLHGYYVYRSSGAGAWVRIAGVIETPSYSDRDVKPGTVYRYAVSAVDQIGNESERSKPIEVTMP